MNEPKKENPESWDVETLKQKWGEAIDSAAAGSKAGLSLIRFRRQAEQGAGFGEIENLWPTMSGAQRTDTWSKLISSIAENTAETLPVCVQCGDCCRGASPTLMLDDLELLREEKIKWTNLVTLRVGEPVHSTMTGEAFHLTEERIKIREKKGVKECVFFDSETNLCSIYLDRPMQCRAQACWDPKLAQELAEETFLTRRAIFKDIEVLAELLEEHDRRCSFDKLKEAFAELEKSEGKSIDAVIEILAFDEHFRGFVGETLKIPEDTLDLVFGRSLSKMVRLFGFRVEIGADGSRTLLPEKS